MTRQEKIIHSQHFRIAALGICDIQRAMDILTDRSLLERIDAFLDQHGMKPSRFGREAMGDGALIQHLRAGRSLSLRNAEKVVLFMENYQPDPASQEAA